MAAGPDGARVRALRLADFRVLVGELCTLARLNGRIIAGQAAGTEDFHEVLQRLSPVADSAPDWPELGFLVAQVAERAGESARALQLYEKLLRLDDTTPLEPGLHRAADDRITALRVAVAPARSAREAAFVDAVRAYEERLGLGPPHPDVVFMEDPTKWQGAQAVWNEERRRYEVSPNAAADPAVQLEKYVALMGRFMAQHYGRCLPGLSADLWNQFRLSVVEFLIASEPGTAYQPAIHFPLLESLRLMSDDAGAEPVRRLALRLLDRFDCDWTAENLVEKLVPIAADVGVPEQVVRSRLERPAGDDEVAG
jgi:hypothetical protein